MEFILNDESLCGQFDKVSDFLESLRQNIKCFQIINNSEENKIYKTFKFYENKVTKSDKLLDLKKYNDDELVSFLIQLDEIIYENPYWDNDFKQDLSENYTYKDKDINCTSIAEAAENKIPLLSFRYEEFMDKELDVYKGKECIKIQSIYTPKYLTEKFGKELKMNRIDRLRTMYNNTRIDCSLLSQDCGINELEESEFELLIGTLDKFINHASWESIATDDGLEYKKYHNTSNNSPFWRYKDKTIMKFRFSSVMRVFGYRRGDRFRVIRFERDHRLSDNG
jgi:hypothetical protein